MNSRLHDELAIEQAIKARFGVNIDIRQVITANLPVSQTAEATLFLTTKKQLYVYISGQSRLLLGDVKKMISRMGLRAELFIPPKGYPRYFDEIAQLKFREVFPGRVPVNDSDLTFYRTLVPYGPALVLISEVKDGEIYRFDSDAKTGWRLAVRFAYRRIKTS